MDNWLYYHRIIRKERLAFAISQLTGDAYKWLLQEVDDRWYYKEPTLTTWEELKELLRNKYARKSLVRKEAYSPQPKEASKTIQTKKMEPKSTTQPNKATKQAIVHQKSLNSSLDSSGERKKCQTMEQENDKAEAVLVCSQLPRVEDIMVIKEKLPDPPPPNKTRGNYFDSQKRMKANLLSLGADCTILRPIKKTDDQEIFTPHRSQSRDPCNDYQDQLRLKKKRENIGKQSNFFVRAGEVKQNMFSEQPLLLFFYKEALMSLTNLAPVLPSEMKSLAEI